ncbi:MAG TPA: hypothetical protein VJT83_09065 [Chitinophagaceae bacterium]|nr:hypothetical protein [Chitinophagaceae bacterium]
MKQQNAVIYSSLILLAMTLTSCEVVGGIFKAGIWTGIIVVVLVVVLIFWLINRGRK